MTPTQIALHVDISSYALEILNNMEDILEKEDFTSVHYPILSDLLHEAYIDYLEEVPVQEHCLIFKAKAILREVFISYYGKDVFSLPVDNNTLNILSVVREEVNKHMMGDSYNEWKKISAEMEENFRELSQQINALAESMKKIDSNIINLNNFRRRDWK